MINSCVVEECKNEQNALAKRNGVSFHMFPKERPLRMKWLKAIGSDQGLSMSQYDFVCSDHFPTRDFIKTGRIVRLKDGAVPSVFPKKPKAKTSSFQQLKSPSPKRKLSEKEEGQDAARSLKEQLKNAKALEKEAVEIIRMLILELCSKNLYSLQIKAKVKAAAISENWSKSSLFDIKPTPANKIDDGQDVAVSSESSPKKKAKLSGENQDGEDSSDMNDYDDDDDNLYDDSEQGISGSPSRSTRTHEDDDPPSSLNKTTSDTGLKGNPVVLLTRLEDIGSTSTEDQFIKEKSDKDALHAKNGDLVPEPTENESNAALGTTPVQSPTNLEADSNSAKVIAPEELSQLLKSEEKTRYECGECETSYRDIGEFKVHLQECHDAGIELEALVNSSDEVLDGSSTVEILHATCMENMEALALPGEDEETVYVCGACGVTYSSLDDLRVHIEEHEDEETPTDDGNGGESSSKRLLPGSSNSDTKKPLVKVLARATQFKCTMCAKTFNFQDQLDRHMSMHSESKDRKYVCKTCGNKYTTSSALHYHMRMHSGEKPFKCEQCGKLFRAKYHLERHKKTHTGVKSFCCQVCGLAYSQKSRLDVHMRSHTGEKPYSCETCGRAFHDKSLLRQHMQVHTKEKRFVCSVCGKAYGTRNSLRHHQKVHTGDRPFKCAHCDLAFRSNVALRDHTRVHTGERPFQCDVCGKVFKQKGHLYDHSHVHEDEATDAIIVCKICDKTCKGKRQLKYHMKIHRAAGCYICGVCGRNYKYKKSLMYHSRVHFADKPHKCLICKESFRLSSELNSHIKQHTGQGYQAFQCGLCKKKFRSQRMAELHIDKHHTEDQPPVPKIKPEVM